MTQSSWMSRVLAAVVVVMLASGAPSSAQDEPGDASAFLPRPTKEHERLQKDVGVWDAEIKTWTTGPEGEPTVSKGVERNRLLHGGLWLISNFEGDFAGIPFVGHGQTGYDPGKGKYVGAWVDSMSTRVMVQEGTYDEASETLTLEGELESPTGQVLEQQTVSRYKDGVRSMTMSMRPKDSDGEFVKMMEITYTRRADRQAEQ